MKSISFVLILAFVLAAFPNSALAQTYLIENQTWEQNLTKVAHSSSIFGDIDNDGDLDLILTGVCGASCYIAKAYINNGTCFVENQTWQQNLTAINYGSLAFGDVDNDGDLDLALSGCSSGGGIDQCNNPQTLLYINNGTSLVESQNWQYNLINMGESSLAFGDINNDGKLDLAITGYMSNSPYVAIKIYINNGTTLLENESWQQNLTAVHLGSLSLGDIDNDGDLDLAITGRDVSSQKVTKVYINNGTTLTEDQTWQQNLINADESSLTFGDIDNDGDLDLSLIGCCDRHRIYNNTGTSFIEIEKENTAGGDLAGIFAGSLAWGDYDNDGDLDLIATGREGATTIYLNDNSNFPSYSQDPELQIPDIEWSSVCWSDLDNDRDLDLVLFGWKSSVFYARIYTNNITAQNTLPNSLISGFNTTFNFTSGKLTFSWGNGSDTETPALGLYYNLRVGTCSGCHDVVSGVYGGSSNPTAGYFGNMMQRKRIVLNRPDLENKTIYWAVQTIDTGLAKSAWSTEQVYHITQQCTENWTYGEWTTCSGGQQTRTATDSNNCGTTINKGVVVQSCSSAPSGGSPAGSSPSPSVTAQNKSSIFENVTWYFEKINAGVDTGFILNETINAINQVWIKVRNEANEVYVNIKRLESKPPLVTKEPAGNVYQYLNITFGNLSAENVDVGKIRFVVSKTWIENNSINKSSVNLLRYQSGDWQGLKTILNGEDDSKVYYLAETPGFSVFAITGESIKEIKIICNPSGMKCNENKLEECSEDGTAWSEKENCMYGCENAGCKGNPQELGYVWMILSIAAIAVTGFYFLKTRKPRASVAPGTSLS